MRLSYAHPSIVILAAIAANPLAAQNCANGAQDFSQWVVERGGICWQQSPSTLFFDGNGTGLIHSPCDWEGGTTTSISFGIALTGGGSTGIVLGYDPGESSSANPDYLVAFWQQRRQSVLELEQVTGPLDAFGRIQSSIPLAASATGHNVAGVLEISMSASNLRIAERGRVLIDEAGDFTPYIGAGQRYGIVSFGAGIIFAGPEQSATAPATLPTFVPHGGGCAGQNGIPSVMLASGQPRIGQQFAIDVIGRPSGSAAQSMLMMGDLAYGVSIDLGLIGMPGCGLRVLPFFVLPIEQAVTLSLPQDPTMVGTAFALQSLHVDPGANALGVTLGHSAIATIGR